MKLAFFLSISMAGLLAMLTSMPFQSWPPALVMWIAVIIAGTLVMVPPRSQ